VGLWVEDKKHEINLEWPKLCNCTLKEEKKASATGNQTGPQATVSIGIAYPKCALWLIV